MADVELTRPIVPTRSVVRIGDDAPARIRPAQDPELDSWTDTWLMAALIIAVGVLVLLLGS